MTDDDKEQAKHAADERLLRERFGFNRADRRGANAIERKAGRKLSLKERIAAGNVWNP